MGPRKSLIERLYRTMTDEQIGRRLGLSGHSIGDWRRKFGIPTKPRVNRYRLNHEFFAVIDTEEKAYILGLIASDGWISKSEKQVCLSLGVKDVKLLRDVRRAMDSDARIFNRGRGGFPGSQDRCQIIFDSKRLAADLIKLGVTPAKSKTLRYPQVPRKLERHLVRGFFDGDGHVRAIPKRLFYILGTKHVVKGLRSAICRETGISLNARRQPGCWRIAGYGGSADVLRWFYKGATIFLARKRRVFLKYWQ